MLESSTPHRLGARNRGRADRWCLHDLMAQNRTQDEMSFSHFVTRAKATEKRVDCLQADDDLVRRLIEVAAATASLVDLYKKSFYYQQPIPEDLFAERLDRARASLLHLPRCATSKDWCRQNPRLLLASIGIFTEAGELLESLLSGTSGETYDTLIVREELGDLNWYQAIALDELGTSLEAVVEMNVAKLTTRYPRRFTLDDASERDPAAERAALEEQDARRARIRSER